MEEFKLQIKTHYKPKSGRLLIAEPLLRGDIFSRSVVYLMSHNVDGSFGFVVNKPSEYCLGDIHSGFRSIDIPVFEGGPVQPDSMFVVHQYPDLLGGEKFDHDICIGCDFDLLLNALSTKQISTQKIKFFMGYSGWHQQQLDEEVERDTWMVGPHNSVQLFNYNYKNLWQNSVLDLGNPYAYLINFPVDPENN